MPPRRSLSPSVDNFKNIFDLYLTDSTVEAKKCGTKTVTDSMAEFALEKCAMVQNGNWAWEQIAGVTGNKVQADKIKFLPIYIGADGEENQGLCVGTENFYAINAKATEAQQKAAADLFIGCILPIKAKIRNGCVGLYCTL